MKLFVSLAFLVVVCFGQLYAETTVRVATYNLRNYLELDRWVDGHYRQNYPKPEAEKEALRKVIVSANPDVLVVQEMGQIEFLKELQADLRQDGLDYPFIYLAEASDSKRHVALLSRFKPTVTHTHKDLFTHYFGKDIAVKRGLMEVEFETAEIRWKIYGIHLKSRWSDVDKDPESAIRRRAESLAVRKRIIQMTQEEDLPFLVLGDLNDVKNSAAVRLLQKKGNTQICTALECVDLRDEKWTHYYAKEDSYSRVDYILCSPTFEQNIVEGSMKITSKEEALLASDHRMLWVDLTFSGNE